MTDDSQPILRERLEEFRRHLNFEMEATRQMQFDASSQCLLENHITAIMGRAEVSIREAVGEYDRNRARFGEESARKILNASIKNLRWTAKTSIDAIQKLALELQARSHTG